MTSLVHAWAAIRASLESLYFSDIKTVMGLSGLDLTCLAHLEQKPEKGATKGQLMTAVDSAFGKMGEDERQRFTAILTEELLRRKPDVQTQLDEHLSRLGWSVIDRTLVPVEIFDASELEDFPVESRQDMVKAAQRFRDGDLSGAVSAACGAVDSVTTKVYSEQNLGDPGNASFQERCKRAVSARGVIPAMENELRKLGWKEENIVPFKKNFEGALNQGAFVIQTLRSSMGDVHGTKPILRPLVFDSIKWAELLIRAIE
jgi:hypothetical protein